MTKKGYMGFGFMVFVFSIVAGVIFGLIFALPIILAQFALIFGNLTIFVIFLAVLLVVGIPVFLMILGYVFVKIGKYRRIN